MSSTSTSTLRVAQSDEKSPKTLSPEGGAQRFFSQGKRIPKDVKRHCGMCKQHGVIVETRGHTCEYKNCNCEHCDLVRQRREIMSTQIRLRREQDKKFQRTTDINEANVFPGCNGEPDEKTLQEGLNMCYFCQKCKNHSVLVWKKNHKKECQFTNCNCEQCALIDSRRALDRHIKKRRMSMRAGTGSAPKSPKKEGSSCSSLSASSSNLEESPSSSDCSLSGLLSEKLKVEPQQHHHQHHQQQQQQHPVQVKFDFSAGSFLTPSARSSVNSPFEITPPLILPQSPVPLVLPLPTSVGSAFLPSFIASTCASPIFSSPLYYGSPNLLPNPFLMPIQTLEMQILLQNLQSLNELNERTAAVTLENTN